MSVSESKVNVEEVKERVLKLSFSSPGESDDEHDQIAEEMSIRYGAFKEEYPDKKFSILVDLTNAGIPTKRARELYVKALSDKQIDKVAFFGVGLAIKSIVDFIIDAAGKGQKVEFFIDEEKAMEWLESGN